MPPANGILAPTSCILKPDRGALFRRTRTTAWTSRLLPDGADAVIVIGIADGLSAAARAAL